MVFLALGSNAGDRDTNLAVARARLARRFGVTLACSQVFNTTAIGFEGADFLNQVVAFDSPLSPMEVLDICQEIEVEMGRKVHIPRYNADGTRLYQDRIIDIDILKDNGIMMNSERLVLPHPQCKSRPYVEQLVSTFDEKIQKAYNE
ncbi:MAG: 2-amino-4-hydroxy-6-hydroxymethyldihydropteridine diphosphokinase [Bacteroidales bacterium]|nr:2-amino-4-hydroxy-6-hydroxymethyldihydropteridine diphosphokinase [Bacteroidales bacterium]